MLIWLGVTGTILCVLACALVGAVVWAVFRLESRAEFIDDAQDAFLDAQKSRMEREYAWLKEFSGVLAEFSRTQRNDSERSLADWKHVSESFTKSSQELTDNLAALLREIKVSKQLAQGAMALVEQNVAAVDRLWQMVEMIRRGPRSAANIAPSDAEIAARERGESPEQAAAMDAMLAAARDRHLNSQDDII